MEEEIEKREKLEEMNNIGDESGIEQSSIWSDSGMSSSMTTDSDIFELHQDYRVRQKRGQIVKFSSQNILV